MPQYIVQDFVVLPDGMNRVVAGGSIFPFDVKYNLLAERVWKRLGSPPIQSEHIGYLNSLDGEIEVQKKTTLTVKFPNKGPMELDFGIYDDEKTLHCDAVLKSDILREVNPFSFPVHSQAIILDDNEFPDKTCWVCLESIKDETEYVLHCGGDPRPTHLSCFTEAQSGPSSDPEGNIMSSLSLCACCRYPFSGLLKKADIPNRVDQVVSHVWPEAKILSVSYQPQAESGRFQVKILNGIITSVALKTISQSNQAQRLKRQADVLALFEEAITRTHSGTNLLPRHLARGSLPDQEGRIYYLLTSPVSVVSSAGQLDRVRRILELHRKETPQDGMFGFLPEAYHLNSYLRCEASPKWSTFLRQWIALIQKPYYRKRYEDRVSNLVAHLYDLIEKLIEPLEDSPKQIKAGLTPAPFDVDASSPGTLGSNFTPLWGHWEFMFATVLHRCFPEVSEYLIAQTDELLEDRNRLYTLILVFHLHEGCVFEKHVKMATDLLAKYGDSTISPGE